MKIIGIDYSLNGTAVYEKDTASKDENYMYFTNDKKTTDTNSIYIDEKLSQPEKIDIIIKFLQENYFNQKNIDLVVLEAAALSKNYEWQEAYGIIKHKLRLAGIKYITIVPTSLKLYATGSGRADKTQMSYHLRQQTGLDFDYLGDIANNIVDAAWLINLGENYLECATNPKQIQLLPDYQQSTIENLLGLKPKKVKTKKKKAA